LNAIRYVVTYFDPYDISPVSCFISPIFLAFCINHKNNIQKLFNVAWKATMEESIAVECVFKFGNFDLSCLF